MESDLDYSTMDSDYCFKTQRTGIHFEDDDRSTMLPFSDDSAEANVQNQIPKQHVLYV